MDLNPIQKKRSSRPIYGIKSSGNQSERVLRERARLHRHEYSRVNDIIQNDVYVDDYISGEEIKDVDHQSADELETVKICG